MSERDRVNKRRGGSTLLIIFLILGLALLFFVFIAKEFDIRLLNRASASIEKGREINHSEGRTEQLPTVNPRQVSMVYVTKDGKMVSCFIRVMNAMEKNIFYVEVPLNSKLTLSSELYRDLLTYAPALPQFVKLSRAANYFSENYRYEACTRILSENIGTKITDWCVMAEQDFQEFMNKTSGDGEEDFLYIYKKYANQYRSSQSSKERWAYYEIFEKSDFVDRGTVPGQWDKTDYNIMAVHARELIEELKY